MGADFLLSKFLPHFLHRISYRCRCACERFTFITLDYPTVHCHCHAFVYFLLFYAWHCPCRSTIALVNGWILAPSNSLLFSSLSIHSIFFPCARLLRLNSELVIITNKKNIRCCCVCFEPKWNLTGIFSFHSVRQKQMNQTI